MNSTTLVSADSRSIHFQAQAVVLGIFACNLSKDDGSAQRALATLASNQDADCGLADLGLTPVEFARDNLSAADVEEIVERAGGNIVQLVDQATAPDHQAARDLYACLQDLLTQLDLIGIPDWHGAEGLSLTAARRLLTGQSRLSSNPPAGGGMPQAATGADRESTSSSTH